VKLHNGSPRAAVRKLFVTHIDVTMRTNEEGANDFELSLINFYISGTAKNGDDDPIGSKCLKTRLLALQMSSHA
jgi:hypothetical protein